MKIYLRNQADNFDKLLAALMTKPIMMFEKTKLKEKTSTISIRTEKKLEQINLDFLFNYKYFLPTS